MSRSIYRFKIAGRLVELEQQWAVRISRGLKSPREQSLHYTKDDALRAICGRMGEILDEERGLEKGSGELLVMGAIREAFDEGG